MSKCFECAHCGNCCKQSGDLRLLPEDVEKILRHYGWTLDELNERYEFHGIEDKLYFIGIHNSCPFLTEDNLCELEGEDKPFFCANYIPFIDKEGSPIYQVCQGIGHGREWTDEEIKNVYDLMNSKLVIVHERSDA